jgi:hypothetical protein
MMTKERPWIFSIHCLTRAANKFGLLVDEKARLEIFRELNHEPMLVTRNHGRTLYEISLFGKKVIAVCEVEKRAIVTLMDAKQWYRKRASRNWKKNRSPKQGWMDGAGTEEE